MSATTLLDPAAPSPIEYPHLRVPSGGTLRDIAERFDPSEDAVEVPGGSDIRVAEDGSSITVAGREIAYDDDSMEILLGWVDLPKSLMTKVSPERYRRWTNEALEDLHKPGVARIGERDGLISILTPQQIPYGAPMIVEVAQTVLGEDAPVVDVGMSPGSFYLDVVTTPDVFHDLGDPRIGDVARAGLRFGLNTRQNLAPDVQPFSYRLWCTNGCSTRHEETRLDARGQTVDEVLAELEAKARIAFALVESEVAAMYDLRNEPVTSPERVIARLARDNGLSERMQTRLLNSLPTIVPDTNEMTMFDIVQAATHLANSPGTTSRGSRLILERLGGSIVADHAERCQSCHSRLS